ncbi:MAG: DUF1667 domain-containing protein [Promethearchaeota archaeon]
MSEVDTKVKEVTCIVCPNGCRITVRETGDGSLEVEGAGCKRGVEYAQNEYRSPKRMLITTVRVDGGVLPVVPVRSREPIPKERVFDAMEVVNETRVVAPIKMGDVVIPDILGTGIDVVASRDMEARA